MNDERKTRRIFMLMEPSLHRDATRAAAGLGISFGEYVRQSLRESLSRASTIKTTGEVTT